MATKLKSNFRKAEESPGFMLWKASNLLQRLHSDCLKELKVTPAQFSLMTCLVYLQQSGSVTPSDVVSHAGLDKMMVSDLIKTLEKKKLLVRKVNSSDGRSFFIEPTQLGEKTTNSAVHRVEAIDTKFFKQIPNAAKFHDDLIALVNSNKETKVPKINH